MILYIWNIDTGISKRFYISAIFYIRTSIGFHIFGPGTESTAQQAEAEKRTSKLAKSNQELTAENKTLRAKCSRAKAQQEDAEKRISDLVGEVDRFLSEATGRHEDAEKRISNVALFF